MSTAITLTDIAKNICRCRTWECHDQTEAESEAVRDQQADNYAALRTIGNAIDALVKAAELTIDTALKASDLPLDVCVSLIPLKLALVTFKEQEND